MKVDWKRLLIVVGIIAAIVVIIIVANAIYQAQLDANINEHFKGLTVDDIWG